MNRIHYMVWLAAQAADGLTYLWPVTLLFVSLVGCGLFWDVRSKRLEFDKRLFYLILPTTGVLLILLVGCLFEDEPNLAVLPSIGLGVGVLLAVITVIRLRPAWMTSISVSLCILWYSFWCFFVSGMSVTGRWL